ncbi:hypothetical protein O181_090115 [Austropuccinia psidii MF-1]|uniref:Uncharacterized protein n=1 Tax=Austropuccinia psidii MF-1 TaxID=1389203 RepID=A0A9Q3P6S6_9BASI|nr:hypothetical protein [Austropuccinia psidii MF-1]
MTIIYKEVKSHTNADGLSRWPLENLKRNPSYDPEVAAKIRIHFMEIDRRKNFIFAEWAPESGTPDSGYTDSEGTETPIFGISFSQLHNEFFSEVMKAYANTNSVAYCCNSFNKSTGAQSWNSSWRNPG